MAFKFAISHSHFFQHHLKPESSLQNDGLKTGYHWKSGNGSGILTSSFIEWGNDTENQLPWRVRCGPNRPRNESRGRMLRQPSSLLFWKGRANLCAKILMVWKFSSVVKNSICFTNVCCGQQMFAEICISDVFLSSGNISFAVQVYPSYFGNLWESQEGEVAPVRHLISSDFQKMAILICLANLPQPTTQEYRPILSPSWLKRLSGEIVLVYIRANRTQDWEQNQNEDAFDLMFFWFAWRLNILSHSSKLEPAESHNQTDFLGNCPTCCFRKEQIGWQLGGTQPGIHKATVARLEVLPTVLHSRAPPSRHAKLRKPRVRRWCTASRFPILTSVLPADNNVPVSLALEYFIPWLKTNGTCRKSQSNRFFIAIS